MSKLRRAGHPNFAMVFDAAWQGRIALCVMDDRSAALPCLDAVERPSVLPTLLIIGDGGNDATGPAGWACTAAGIDWQESAFPAGGEGPAAFYQAVLEETVKFGRFLLIETSASHVAAWTRALGGKVRRPAAVNSERYILPS